MNSGLPQAIINENLGIQVLKILQQIGAFAILPA